MLACGRGRRSCRGVGRTWRARQQAGRGCQRKAAAGSSDRPGCEQLDGDQLGHCASDHRGLTGSRRNVRGLEHGNNRVLARELRARGRSGGGREHPAEAVGAALRPVEQARRRSAGQTDAPADVHTYTAPAAAKTSHPT